MNWYYANLPVHMLSDEEFVYIVIDIPLKELQNRFNLYRVVQFPGIIDEQKVMWEISSPYIAISQDKERSVLLSDVEAQICKHGLCKPNAVQMSYIDQQDFFVQKWHCRCVGKL